MAHIDLSDDDKDAFMCVMANYVSLRRFVEDFHQAVHLFEFLEHNATLVPEDGITWQSVHWRMIAAKEAAMSLYHYSCALDAIKRQLPTCIALASIVSSLEVRRIIKQFRKQFRHTDNIRHAIAHAGELIKNPFEQKRNTTTWDQSAQFFYAANGVLAGSLTARLFSLTYRGNEFSVEISQSSIESLAMIMSDVDLAFRKAISSSIVPQPEN